MSAEKVTVAVWPALPPPMVTTVSLDEVTMVTVPVAAVAVVVVAAVDGGAGVVVVVVVCVAVAVARGAADTRQPTSRDLQARCRASGEKKQMVGPAGGGGV